jgi:group I intron endonuclease
MGYIYRIFCRENGKSYIGKTLHDPMKRWKQHVYKAKRNEARTMLGYAINKYGEDAFNVETLCIVPIESIDNMECYYAEQYESYVWQGGYNQTLCGRGRPYTYATKQETKQRMSDAQKGKSLSDETRQKISTSAIGNKWCVGRIMSVESNSKNRASQPRLKLSETDVKIIRENPNRFSQVKLAEIFNVSRTLIYLVQYEKVHKLIS